MPRGKEDAEKVVPALIEGLTHTGNDVRRSSALKLGEFHELAKDAIPALQKAEQDDGDARVREAAGIALSRIDPEQFPYKPKVGRPNTSKGRSAVASQKTLIRGPSVPARSLILTAGLEAFLVCETCSLIFQLAGTASGCEAVLCRDQPDPLGAMATRNFGEIISSDSY